MTKTPSIYGRDLFGDAIQPPKRGKIADEFLVPPFTILNAREGFWQDRKRAWLSQGIKSEVGRGGKGAYPTSGSASDMSIQGVNAGSGPAAEAHRRKSGPARAFNMGMNASAENGWGLEDDHGSGTSIFDPVVCELVYRWFCPPDGTVLDPFAGGSVRGVVAAMLGRRYWGCDLRDEQIAANNDQANDILDGGACDPDQLTPCVRVGDVWLKRDDLCDVHGASGGKARTCWSLAQRATRGLTTAGSRQSPQVYLVAAMAKALGLPFVAHVPEGDVSTGPVARAVAIGATVIQHRAGYNTVICARSREYAAEHGYTEIPFGMECEEAVTQTSRQVANVPDGVGRIVVPVGSGMSLAGVLWGLRNTGRRIPVVGVVVGSDPVERLDRYAPPSWREMVELVPSGVDYERHVAGAIGGVDLDPVYEAKCVPFVGPGDLFWIVGHRDPVAASYRRPRWACGDSATVIPASAPECDLVFSCPPYGDLEVYSDDPKDLSAMEWQAFLTAYRAIVAASVARLRKDRFACFVVGDFRDGRGLYRNFVAETIAAFHAAGAALYNEAILVTAVGSLPVRVRKQFAVSRKMGKTHQNILVFVKGDPKRATVACGDAVFGERTG